MARQTHLDVYNQQRGDTQNLFGTPYATLGSLMGMNIQPIGAFTPSMRTAPIAPQPAPNVPLLQRLPGAVDKAARAVVEREGLAPGNPRREATLAQLAARAGRSSGYQKTGAGQKR